MAEILRFLDPAVLASISKLELRAKAVVDGFILGLHKSPKKGFSVEFTDYRHYFPGDDIRHVDWKVFARSGKYYIKQFEDETNLPCQIILDSSASMGYHHSGISKLDYGKTLAASLAFLMKDQRDAVGLVSFDEKIREFIPPRYHRGHLVQILGALNRIQPGGPTTVQRPLIDLASSLKRKGLVILISDLLDDEEMVIKGLQQLRACGNDLLVFHLLDHAELTFPFEQMSEFVDSENQESLLVSPQMVREAYLEEIHNFCDHYRKHCQLNGIDYCLLDTKRPLDYALSSYLIRRGKKH